jgi:hypothetical protein
VLVRYQGVEIYAHLGGSRLGRTAHTSLPRERWYPGVPHPYGGEKDGSENHPT